MLFLSHFITVKEIFKIVEKKNRYLIKNKIIYEYLNKNFLQFYYLFSSLIVYSNNAEILVD